MNNFNWDSSFSVDFDLHNGLSKAGETTKRRLSQMRDAYSDSAAVDKVLESKDPIIYEFHELGCPERKGDLAFGTSIVYAGKIGTEYYMTKGHFHTILDTAEVYFTLSGEGYMVMENPEGDTMEMPLKKGEALYVPRRYAHRSVNTGKEPLVMFFTFGADAGHDYGTIETKGYRKLIIEENSAPKAIENSRWN
ncbi:MAG: glucose-6-phosphate isomerase family protein [Lachnospiraceae bacterium]|nr:glucose-6-phosphate isomerase family protein [Lachnospiraceae bacterium]